MNETYLGDSVYIKEDKYGLVMFLNNGEEADGQKYMKHPIFLEEDVIYRTIMYLNEWLGLHVYCPVQDSTDGDSTDGQCTGLPAEETNEN